MIPIKDSIRRLLVKLSLASPRSLSRVEQGPKCLLLNMPLEILFLVFKHLPVSSQMCIILTCHNICHSLSPFRNQILRHRREERIQYLGLLARDYPDYWVDDANAELVKIEKRDLPEVPYGPPMLDTPGWNWHVVGLFERGALMVGHKHVQIAVKYSQLQKKTWRQKKYLKALLRPYGTEFFPHFLVCPVYASPTIGKSNYWTCPKVVSGSYLVFKRWHFLKRGGPLLLQEIGSFGPCLHQYIGSWQYHGSVRRHLYSGIGGPFEQASETSLVPESGGNRRDTLFSCLQQAFHQKGNPANGACPWCCTEFSVLVERQSLTLSVWRDLGGASPLNPVWTGHLRAIEDPDTPGVERDPLEIRARYGSLPLKD